MTSLPEYDDSIYTGVWTNWAHGRLLGATLTTTRTHGSLLIAFLSLFITFVGTRFWRIGCFIVHYIYSTSAPRDGLYHQRQAILRNAANGTTGLWGFCEVLYAWRKTAKRPYRRILPPLLFTLITLIAFALASTFSSRISSADETQVLLSGSGCSKILSFSESDHVHDKYALYVSYLSHISGALSSSANYAQQCYSEGFNDVGCRKFVSRNIRTKANRSASCPFDPKICKSQDSNLLLDTGFIDSREDLGLNTPQDGRFLYRRLLHCAPLMTEGYSRKESANGSREESVMLYFYGNTSSNNYTHRYPIGTSWADLLDHSPDFTLDARSATYHLNGSWSEYDSSFQPIDELKIEDSKVIIVFLSTNEVVFVKNSSDIWYSANRLHTNGTDAVGFPLYRSYELASPLGCLEKSQLCNPNLPPGKDCTQFFSSSDDNNTTMLWPDEADRKVANWNVELAGRLETSALSVVQLLTQSSLESSSRRANGFQGPIANNQWQLDVEKWHNISMARLQQLFVETATGSLDTAMRDFLSPPLNDRMKRLCKSQMIQSTAYTNFSVFGLAVVFIGGGLVVTLSYVMEPLACWIQHRYGLDVYTRFEWTMNETLQLQRLAHEELGVGSWKHCDGNVPITEWRDQLAVIDLEDSAHPKLKPPPPLLEEVMLSTLAEGSTRRRERDEDGSSRDSSECGALASAWDSAENVGPQIFTEDTVPLTQHTSEAWDGRR